MMITDEDRERFRELGRRLWVATMSYQQGVTMAHFERINKDEDMSRLGDLWIALAKQATSGVRQTMESMFSPAPDAPDTAERS